MIRLNEQLFQGQRVCLTAHEPGKDAEVESRWTHDPEFLRLLSIEPARPLSPGQIKKRHEEAEKEKNPRRFSFAVRLRGDDRLLGFARLDWVDWSNGASRLSLGLGAPGDRRQGYGTEALRLLLRFAFEELNLHRTSAHVGEYNLGALRWLERAGFRVEVRRPQALYREGRRWDDLWLGLLRDEWTTLERAR